MPNPVLSMTVIKLTANPLEIRSKSKQIHDKTWLIYSGNTSNSSFYGHISLMLRECINQAIAYKLCQTWLWYFQYIVIIYILYIESSHSFIDTCTHNAIVFTWT